jgi:hypothetical protein
MIIKPYSFFLGGHDLEMQAIRGLVKRHPTAILYDCGLAWGARASAYHASIVAELAAGRVPVLVELSDDLPTDFPRDKLVIVDHHNERAGKDVPTSLEQVFRLIGLPSKAWDRDLELIAANDRGHVSAMRSLVPPATDDELRRIRAADRAAQGISAAEEAAASAAIASSLRSELAGKLTIVELPHGRIATVTDRLDADLGGPGFRNLLVRCPDLVFFVGAGNAIAALRERWPDSFCGGELPLRGYWGRTAPTPLESILELLAIHLQSEPTP